MIFILIFLTQLVFEKFTRVNICSPKSPDFVPLIIPTHITQESSQKRNSTTTPPRVVLLYSVVINCPT